MIVSAPRTSSYPTDTAQTAINGVSNVLLVHAASSDATSWATVAPMLKGMNVASVQLSFSSFAADVAAVRRAVERADGSVAIFADTQTEAIIGEAVIDLEVAQLIYIDTLTPGTREAAASLFAQFAAVAPDDIIASGGEISSAPFNHPGPRPSVRSRHPQEQRMSREAPYPGSSLE
ncbi:hypothetical protein [Novosphingobium terrae]|uniref:hypothetical protein n=1 Tax=Novosphingobium terrae TaxID=2726189 RepID=UPI0019804F6D|nr:hypothetical protein [Novosphingobium terrae]